MASMKTVLLSMKDAPNTEKSNRLHKLAVATSGGIGGAFGFAKADENGQDLLRLAA